jgi:molecular chaperone DnaK (HSP70)
MSIDYLSKLRKHVVDHLIEKYGSVAFSSFVVQWVITVPAVWTADAKKLTRSCAEAAGMGTQTTISITSEPEAAAGKS